MSKTFVGLSGVEKNPFKILDKLLLSYISSDTAKHAIPVTTNSLRSDMVDGEDRLENIRSSLTTILSTCFDSVTVDMRDLGKEGNVESFELSITASMNGKIVTLENMLSVPNSGIAKLQKLNIL